jgi:hypothetical protein
MIDQKQLITVECFNYLGSMIRDDARRTREVKSKIVMAKVACNRKKIPFTSKLDLKFDEKTSEFLHLEHSIYGAETRTFRKVDQKYP